jgi:hypothetical protein
MRFCVDYEVKISRFFIQIISPKTSLIFNQFLSHFAATVFKPSDEISCVRFSVFQ